MTRPLRLSGLAGVLVSCILAARVSVQQPAAAPAFRTERPIDTKGAGPRRLAVDVPLLTAAGEGLADLRLFDAAGHEVPYLLVSRPPAEPAWAAGTILPVMSADTRSLKTSGFETDLGEPRFVDRFRLTLPPPQSFLKRVRLEGSGDRTRWTLLVAEGTLFSLPDERLHETELGFAPGSYRFLRVTWDDTNSGRLPVPLSAEARTVADIVPPPPLTTALVVEQQSSEPGRSHYRIRLPGGHLPIVALRFDLGGGHVMRKASVYEARLAGAAVVPVLAGTTTLQRVVQGTLIASSLDLPLTRAIEPQLDLVIDDGDNPPLDIRSVSAVLAAQPWIYFEAGDSPLVARYGNATLATPRYDLEAMRDTLQTTIDNVRNAAWGEARAGAPGEQLGSAQALPTIGAPLDAARFDYLRDVPAGDGGLMAVPLDAAVLAHSAGAPAGFADVRVIDPSDQQVPYLLERRSEPLSLDLALTRLTQPLPSLGPESKATVYRIALPFKGLPSSRLVVTTSARVFRRLVTIGIERQLDQRHRDPWLETSTSLVWTHADQDAPAPALTVPLSSVDEDELLLMVEEGDNTALPITSARMLLPAYRLRFFRDRGVLVRLAYGRADLTAPRYDLAQLAPQLLGLAATEIEAVREQPSRSATSTAALVSPRLFWAALAIAVVILFWLIARLLKKDQPAN